MARRESSEQRRAAYAREALARVEEADEPEAAAARALSNAPDQDHRRAVLEMSSGAGEAAQAALIRAALDSEDDELARVGAEQLIDLRDSEAAEDLLARCFQSLDSGVRRRAVEALEPYTGPRGTEFLARALTDEADIVRRSATVVFGLVVGTSYHELNAAILEELSDADSELARAVIENEDEQVREQVAQAVAFAESEQMLPTLERLVDDEDPEVRQEVALALAAIGTDRAIELMGRMLSDESYTVASTVLDMLAAQLGAGSSQFLEYLKAGVDHDQPQVRRQAVLMLDRYDPAEVVPILQEAAEDEDFEVSRRAGELLRRMQTESDLGWLSTELQEQLAGDRALPTWEAGNIGLEAGAQRHADVEESEERLSQVIPMLERAIREGTPSDKIHAINELSGLKDIADSPPMLEALHDPDSSVRSRAADALTYSRDAGLLVEVMMSHPDDMVRRRAAEALRENPGGPSDRGELRATVSLAGIRTFGTELYSYFLRALYDEDTGVCQHACSAIRDCAQSVRVLPVGRTLEELERLEQSGEVSALVQEDAAETADEVEDEVDIPELIVQTVGEVLEWRGRAARHAHALLWDEEQAAYRLREPIGEQEAEQWAEDCGLDDEQVQHLRRASAGSEPLDPDFAETLVHGLVRSLSAALQCLAHGADSLRLTGRHGPESDLQDWADALESGPALNWRPEGRAAAGVRRLGRLRARALVAAEQALCAMTDAEPGERLQGLAEAEDDWVTLTALLALADLRGRPAELAERIAGLCQAYTGEKAFFEPVGRGAVMVLDVGVGEAWPALKFALDAAGTDPKMALVQRLMSSVQNDEVASRLVDALGGRVLSTEAELCAAVALRGAGCSLEELELPEPEACESPDSRALCLAVGAMENDAESAEQLQTVLREGDPHERYVAAWCLSLARVRSAVPVFASVRDREAAYMLQALAAGSLLRRGHIGGPSWFEKVLSGIKGEAKARVVTHLSRAVEDMIPLMLKCRDVNAGRFV